MDLQNLMEALGVDPTDPQTTASAEDFNNFEDFIVLLYEKRKATGLTQTAVAKIMETHQSVISDFERLGDNPTIETIQRYARAVGYRVLLELEPTKPALQNAEAKP